MLQEVGDKILFDVYEYYKGGYKSSNKIYRKPQGRRLHSDEYLNKLRVRGENQQKALDAMLSNTNEYQGSAAGNAFEMARLAALLVVEEGSKAVIGRVKGKAKHAFCVADYRPHDNSPKHVQDIFLENCGAAWVIDPWMNLSCPLGEYPARAAAKLVKWSDNWKQILYKPEKFGVNAPFDPKNEEFTDAFLTSGPLTFVELEDLVQLAVPWWLAQLIAKRG